MHAPGRTEPAAALRAAHHLNLAHGLGVRRCARLCRPATQISLTLNSAVVRPLHATPPPTWTRRAGSTRWPTGIFPGPMLHGAYPEDLLADTAR